MARHLRINGHEGSRDPRNLIVQVFATLLTGGAEVRSVELLEASGLGGQQMFLTLAPGQGPLYKRVEATGAKLAYIRVRSWNFGTVLLRYLLKSRPRVVHVHLGVFSGPILAVALLAGVPRRIAHFRSDGPRSRLTVRDRLFRWLVGLCATDILGVSPGALTHGWKADWGNDSRCRVVLSGLDLSRFSSLDGSSVPGLNDLPDCRLIVHVGRDMPVKRRQLAIEIIAAAQSEDLRLAFVGRDAPENRITCKQKAVSLGVEDRVQFLGERGDVPQILAGSDCLLLTSSHEGLPGVVLEARAAGAVVVASDLPGTRFIAERLGGVYLCPAESTADTWALAIAKALATKDLTGGLEQLRGSDFDMRITVNEYRSLWECDGAT